jgi:hypothetical protein
MNQSSFSGTKCPKGTKVINLYNLCKCLAVPFNIHRKVTFYFILLQLNLFPLKKKKTPLPIIKAVPTFKLVIRKATCHSL